MHVYIDPEFQKDLKSSGKLPILSKFPQVNL